MATDAAQTLAENVQWVIENSGWDSQAKLAKAAGIDQKTISRIVNRANMPTLDKLIALAKTMRIEPTSAYATRSARGCLSAEPQLIAEPPHLAWNFARMKAKMP